MLQVINLFVIDKIFKEVAEVNVSPMSMMLYINCLTFHFKDKPATVSGAVAFEIFEEDIKNYDKYKPFFQELHKAKLITIGSKSIVFNNVWGKFIDRSKLDKVKPEEYVAGFTFRLASSFKEELIASQQLIELAQMKHKINKGQVERLIEMFILEQDAFQKKYINFSECIKHCSYWMGMNADKAPKEVVKSGGKILGK